MVALRHFGTNTTLVVGFVRFGALRIDLLQAILRRAKKGVDCDDIFDQPGRAG